MSREAEALKQREERVIKRFNKDQLAHLALLNKQQRKAVIDILDWGFKPVFGSEPARILAGFAGTGKTFCIRLISSVFSNVVLSAPTNKAVKELTKLDTGLPCKTIYSLLGLKMEQHEDTIRLVKSSHEKSTINRYKVVILDEAGMTNSELLEYIEAAMRTGVKILFVGDPRQLPPVGEEKSKIWGRYEMNVLTKVERHDNQILDFATHIRKAKTSEYKFKSNNDKKEGVWFFSHSRFNESLVKAATKGLFSSGEAKAVAWRNRTVDELNQIIRRAIHGDKVFDSRYLVGDKVVFTSPYAVDKFSQISTDDEADIIEVTEGSHTDYELKVYYLTLQIEKNTYVVKVIHEDDEARLQRMLADLSNQARSMKSGSREIWAEFWNIRNSMAYIKHGYALTAHRAQGSTYTNVFVDTADILSNANTKEARKCLYVAVSRPTTKLLMC